jgi:two-component system sensor histidine kinase HydH
MQSSVVVAGFERIRREEMLRVFQRTIAVRRVLQPVVLLIMVSVIVMDGASWRALLMLSAPLLAMLVTLAEAQRMKRLGVDGYTPQRDFLIVPIVVPIAAVCTGGFHSPFLTPLIPLLVFMPMFLSRRKSLLACGAILTVVWVFALLSPYTRWMMPLQFMDEWGRLNERFYVFAAFTTSVFAVAANQYGIGLKQMNDSMLERSLAARNEALAMYQERLRDLTLLSGEIAHELKNPLASIRGLAQLMQTDSPKNPKRLEVLRGEVERMQEILEEFRNFSRPLVPLSQTDVDVGELCREVVSLHEGVAAARRLQLIGPSARLGLRCDARKVKQILVNLVQNAVEASSPGGEVLVAVERESDHAAIRVMDRGHGLAREIERRAFDSGVTSKAHGSGLGLTIVRMLAEQHRGSARLFNREGGGCVAEVLLPVGGAEASAARGLVAPGPS